MPQCYNKIYLKDKKIEVDCGKCLNCLENRKQEASTRMMLEIQNYVNKYFVTLTYEPGKADYDEEGFTKLNREHIKKYIKSLQYVIKKIYKDDYKLEKNKLKYIVSGEYGENNTKRAHYHLVIGTNSFIDYEIRKNWKYGKTYIERLKDARAIQYTAGYTTKKFGKREKEREQPFVKWSIGLGKSWIYKELVAKRIDEKHYNIKTVLGPKRLPLYFKRKFKADVMGVEPKYRKLSKLERQFRREHFGEDRKTIMINQNEYDKNYKKWEAFVNKLREETKKHNLIYLQTEEMIKRYGDKWKDRVYNLMYNEELDEMDEVERNFITLKKRERELLKIKAEAKQFRKKPRRKIA